MKYTNAEPPMRYSSMAYQLMNGDALTMKGKEPVSSDHPPEGVDVFILSV